MQQTEILTVFSFVVAQNNLMILLQYDEDADLVDDDGAPQCFPSVVRIAHLAFVHPSEGSGSLATSCN